MQPLPSDDTDDAAARATVGQLVAFWKQTPYLPGMSAKHTSLLRSATLVTMRVLALPATTTWDMYTIDTWCTAYTQTSHAMSLSPNTIGVYKSRLRHAAQVYLDMQRQPAALGEPGTHAGPLADSALTLPRRTREDLDLIAAAWRISSSDAVVRLIAFYRSAAGTGTRRPANR